jgi:hypothetical protein
MMDADDVLSEIEQLEINAMISKGLSQESIALGTPYLCVTSTYIHTYIPLKTWFLSEPELPQYAVCRQTD